MNQRLEVRGELTARVRLSSPEHGEITAYGLDLSASGIGFLSERGYSAGQHFQVLLRVPRLAPEAGEEEVELVARTIRCDPTGDLIPFRVAACFIDLDEALKERLRHLATPYSGSVALHLAEE
ncbi:PilZ domain-containing protein [Endothiovibrio diazotrophicus]